MSDNEYAILHTDTLITDAVVRAVHDLRSLCALFNLTGPLQTRVYVARTVSTHAPTCFRARVLMTRLDALYLHRKAPLHMKMWHELGAMSHMEDSAMVEEVDIDEMLADLASVVSRTISKVGAREHRSVERIARDARLVMAVCRDPLASGIIAELLTALEGPQDPGAP